MGESARERERSFRRDGRKARKRRKSKETSTKIDKSTRQTERERDKESRVRTSSRRSSFFESGKRVERTRRREK